MADYVSYGGSPMPALQTGHPNFALLRILCPSWIGYAPSAFNPVPVASALKGGTTGVAYFETITAQGGTSPYSFSVTSGALPTGCAMSSGGLISGTPSAAASYTFTVTVTDGSGFTGFQAFTISVAAPSGGGGLNFGMTD